MADKMQWWEGLAKELQVDIEILDDILPKKLMPYLPKDFNFD